MPYAILRFAKKKMGGVSAAYLHNERQKETYKSNPDIAVERSPDNYHFIQPERNYRHEVKRLIAAAGCKIRSNSTVMVETLITATPEFMNNLPKKEQQEYFSRAFDFMAEKIGKDNIIAATVHMDEKTPHMHLSFCPITTDKRLSAKDILGNQKQLSKWQTAFHECMSARWNVLERGLSSMETGRKHIPLWLFKSATRLDKQFDMIQAALADINAFNAGKKRDKALVLLAKWLPQAERFTAQIKTVDKHIKALERAGQETEKRVREAEQSGDRRVDNAVSRMQGKVDEKDRELRKAWEQANELRRQIRNQETLIGKIPFELRERLLSQTKSKKEKER